MYGDLNSIRKTERNEGDSFFFVPIMKSQKCSLKNTSIAVVFVKYIILLFLCWLLSDHAPLRSTMLQAEKKDALENWTKYQMSIFKADKDHACNCYWFDKPGII